MEEIAMKKCAECHDEKPEVDFFRRLSKQQKVYRYRTCRVCYRRKNNERIRAAQKKFRASGRSQAMCVKSNAKYSDKKKNRKNDLDLDFVKSMLARPCSYCFRTTVFMTLDRIDNSIGHLKSNVITACRRCNLVRNSMPYEAWLIVAEGMKRATELNLFGNWEGQTFHGDNKCPS